MSPSEYYKVCNEYIRQKSNLMTGQVANMYIITRTYIVVTSRKLYVMLILINRYILING